MQINAAVKSFLDSCVFKCKKSTQQSAVKHKIFISKTGREVLSFAYVRYSKLQAILFRHTDEECRWIIQFSK